MNMVCVSLLAALILHCDSVHHHHHHHHHLLLLLLLLSLPLLPFRALGGLPRPRLPLLLRITI
jgi:hypothetical protein